MVIRKAVSLITVLTLLLSGGLQVAAEETEPADIDTVPVEEEIIPPEDLEDTISDLNENWNGENAQAYLMKCRKLQDNIRKNVNQLRKASETDSTLVPNTYNAEMNSYRIAQKRTYH